MRILIVLFSANLIFLSSNVRAQSSDQELVEVIEIIPSIIIDLKYSTTDNFTNQKLFSIDVPYLAHGAAKALKAVQDSLLKTGLSLKLWDGYRPSSVQALMFEIYPDPSFVAPPGQSSHNRGAAVDVTLVDLITGKELEMPTYFDHFGPEASHGYMGASPQAIANRQKLKLIMEHFGFVPYSEEWWHYSHGPSRNYPAQDFQMR
jgi:D-alanyl-D-alanine dipeptidase